MFGEKNHFIVWLNNWLWLLSGDFPKHPKMCWANTTITIKCMACLCKMCSIVIFSLSSPLTLYLGMVWHTFYCCCRLCYSTLENFGMPWLSCWKAIVCFMRSYDTQKYAIARWFKTKESYNKDNKQHECNIFLSWHWK